ncbi:carbon-nitrogen hydrolase family protein [Demequina sp. NBRC 110054]|uniref:carbon-nitrogen hydrolase family protein n=1 Tax=Demequina sp. NBRC 110054 TaxID=1570343 RepID=UPI0009FC0EC3|nr:carbon-nitrogen hydrolase family protein [Demequina sp. NBRC 110054]
MRIALPRVENLGLTGESHLDAVAALVEHVASDGDVDLVVLPELSVTGYPTYRDLDEDRARVAAVSERADTGTAAMRFRVLAAALDVSVVYGMSERANRRVYNSLVHVDPSGTLSTYRKVHLTAAEAQLWDAGDRARVVRTTAGDSIGLAACHDKTFPVLFKRLREFGAEIAVVSSAWSSFPGNDDVTGDVWAEQSELFDRARAAETGMIVVSTNYAGPKSPGSADRFCDGRRVVDGLGRLLTPIAHAGGAPVWQVDAAQSRRGFEAVHDGDFFTRDRRRIRRSI